MSISGIKLIFGCGYLGNRVAERWLAAGDRVVAVTRSPEHAAELQKRGLQPLVADVTRPETLGSLPIAETVLYAVGFDPRGGQSRQRVQVEGLGVALDALPAVTQRLVLISSTGVYGQNAGQWVDEESPCRPTREAGRAMLAAEQLLAGHRLGPRTVILRLAGIYGPGRLPHMTDILAGKPIAVEPGSYLNLIHVDDAAAAVLAAEVRPKPPRTYVVSDGHPADRRQCYRDLAELLGAPPPQFSDPSPEFLASHHSGNNKRVGNARMLAELGVRLSYPTYKEGVAAAVTYSFRSARGTQGPGLASRGA